MKSKFYIFAMSLTIMSCVQTPIERKSVTDYFNGKQCSAVDSQRDLPTRVGIPVSIMCNPTISIVSGRVMTETIEIPLPKNATIELIKDDRTISTSSLDNSGNFSFKGDYSNGKYLLFLKAKGFYGQSTIQMDSYVMPEIILVAKQTK
ncbi:MAG: hypothetical protein M9962_03145 [Oligoflexia bacterium]|nr:hypothetical protein [Oligoflexia bacterium]